MPGQCLGTGCGAGRDALDAALVTSEAPTAGRPSYRVPSRGGAGHDLEGLLDPSGPGGPGSPGAPGSPGSPGSHHARCHSTVAWCPPSNPMGRRVSHQDRRPARRSAAQNGPGRATGQTQDAVRRVVQGGAPSSPATRTVSRSVGAGGHPRWQFSSPGNDPGPSLSEHAHVPFHLPDSTFHVTDTPPHGPQTGEALTREPLPGAPGTRAERGPLPSRDVLLPLALSRKDGSVRH